MAPLFVFAFFALLFTKMAALAAVLVYNLIV